MHVQNRASLHCLGFQRGPVLFRRLVKVGFRILLVGSDWRIYTLGSSLLAVCAWSYN